MQLRAVVTTKHWMKEKGNLAMQSISVHLLKINVRVRNTRLALLGGLAIGGCLLCSTSSFATFMVLSGNNPGPNEESVQFDDDSVAMTIQGITDPSNRAVEFESPTQFLAPHQSGQRIEAREESDIDSEQVAINDSIIVSLENPDLSFADLIFNASVTGQIGDGGTLTITVNGFESNGDPVSSSFTQDSEGNPLTLDNGSNFFTIVASDGQRITSVDINPDTDSNYTDLRQIRISQIIPEPASCVILGLGGMIYVLADLRRTRCGRRNYFGRVAVRSH
jgi:hypothetical protein